MIPSSQVVESQACTCSTVAEVSMATTRMTTSESMPLRPCKWTLSAIVCRWAIRVPLPLEKVEPFHVSGRIKAFRRIEPHLPAFPHVMIQRRVVPAATPARLTNIILLVPQPGLQNLNLVFQILQSGFHVGVNLAEQKSIDAFKETFHNECCLQEFRQRNWRIT